jgi:hypothetical protein
MQRLVYLLFCGGSGWFWMQFRLLSGTAGEETIFVGAMSLPIRESRSGSYSQTRTP